VAPGAGGGGAPSEGVEERGTDITQEFCSPAAEEGRTRGRQGRGLWVTDIYVYINADL
jgi:hypothetical protein